MANYSMMPMSHDTALMSHDFIRGTLRAHWRKIALGLLTIGSALSGGAAAMCLYLSDPLTANDQVISLSHYTNNGIAALAINYQGGSQFTVGVVFLDPVQDKIGCDNARNCMDFANLHARMNAPYLKAELDNAADLYFDIKNEAKALNESSLRYEPSREQAYFSDSYIRVLALLEALNTVDKIYNDANGNGEYDKVLQRIQEVRDNFPFTMSEANAYYAIIVRVSHGQLPNDITNILRSIMTGQSVATIGPQSNRFG